VAQERAAFHHAVRTVPRPLRIVGVGGAVMVDVEPVCAPLPGVAGDGVEAEAVGREGLDGAGAGVAVIGCVVLGEDSLTDVASVFAVGAELISPGIEFLFEAAAGCVLPLGFGGEVLS
jgi:hypothetical protein